MNCRRVHGLLSAYIDREVTGREMLVIRAHLAQCPDCADECESLSCTKEAVAALRTRAPQSDLETLILTRVARERRAPAVWPALAVASSDRVRQARLAALAAALAVTALALSVRNTLVDQADRRDALAVHHPAGQAGSVADWNVEALHGDVDRQSVSTWAVPASRVETLGSQP